MNQEAQDFKDTVDQYLRTHPSVDESQFFIFASTLALATAAKIANKTKHVDMVDARIHEITGEYIESSFKLCFETLEEFEEEIADD